MLYAGARGRARDIRACFTLGFVRLERHRAAASRQTYALPLGKYHGGDKSIATAIARWSIIKPSRHSHLGLPRLGPFTRDYPSHLVSHTSVLFVYVGCFLLPHAAINHHTSYQTSLYCLLMCPLPRFPIKLPRHVLPSAFFMSATTITFLLSRQNQHTSLYFC